MKHLALWIKGRKQGWQGWWEGPGAQALHPHPHSGAQWPPHGLPLGWEGVSAVWAAQSGKQVARW